MVRSNLTFFHIILLCIFVCSKSYCLPLFHTFLCVILCVGHFMYLMCFVSVSDQIKMLKDNIDKWKDHQFTELSRFRIPELLVCNITNPIMQMDIGISSLCSVLMCITQFIQKVHVSSWMIVDCEHLPLVAARLYTVCTDGFYSLFCCIFQYQVYTQYSSNKQ